MLNRTPAILVLAAGMLLSLAPVAFGQNALGDGRGLEKDMRRNGTGNTPRKSFRDELARRNAVVTGEIGGGKAFRGSAGYRAPTDFRGSTAGDSTFAFRRDSMSSRAVSDSVRGTDSLRFQYTYSTGNARTLERFTNKPVSASLSGGQADTAEKRGLVSQDQRAMRSTTLYSANRELRPSFLGYRREGGEVGTVTASSLLGVKSIPAQEQPRTVTNSLAPGSAQAGSAQAKPASYRSAYEGVRAKLDLFAGPRPPEAKDPNEKPTTEAPGKTKPEAKPAPGESKPGDGAQSALPEWQERLEALRGQLGGSIDAEKRPQEDGGAEKAPPKPTEYVPGSWRERQDFKADEQTSKFKLDDRTLRIIREAGGTVGNLGFGEASPDDPFAVHMRTGQLLLQDGHYFDAEERFCRALTFKNGDEMALVGRIHAEIGAGLSLSAAINLQDLLTSRPELIGVRYTGGSIPPLSRLKAQADQLRNRLTEAKSRGQEPAHDAAILLAYVAYQSGLTADIAPALDDFERVATAEERNLVTVLREVWLKAPEQPLKPIELPPEPAPAPIADPASGK